MKKRIAVDMVLNIIASAIPVFVLQLLILPAVSARVGSSQYGLVVTTISIYNVVSSVSGNTLNNIRLVKGNSYERIANYNILLLILAALNLLITTGFSVYYEGGFFINSILLNSVASSLWLVKEYLIVAFRININYVNIVKSNIILSIGYGLGFLVFRVIGYWQWIYIIGLLMCVVFICIKSQLWKEPIRMDDNFRLIANQTFMLLLATFLYRIPTYADKMIIYPILGGEYTSILYVATLFGKIVSMAITPVSGVMLSYISKSKKKNNQSFLWVFGISCIVGVAGYFVCLLVSKPILGYLYPREIGTAISYIPFTTATIVVNALITVVNPYILNYFDMKWQVVVNCIYVFIYMLLSIPFLMKNGLIGFCIGTLIAALSKLLFELIIFFKLDCLKISK